MGLYLTFSRGALFALRGRPDRAGGARPPRAQLRAAGSTAHGAWAALCGRPSPRRSTASLRGSAGDARARGSDRARAAALIMLAAAAAQRRLARRDRATAGACGCPGERRGSRSA